MLSFIYIYIYIYMRFSYFMCFANAPAFDVCFKAKALMPTASLLKSIESALNCTSLGCTFLIGYTF